MEYRPIVPRRVARRAQAERGLFNKRAWDL